MLPLLAKIAPTVAMVYMTTIENCIDIITSVLPQNTPVATPYKLAFATFAKSTMTMESLGTRRGIREEITATFGAIGFRKNDVCVAFLAYRNVSQIHKRRPFSSKSESAIPSHFSHVLVLVAMARLIIARRMRGLNNILNYTVDCRRVSFWVETLSSKPWVYLLYTSHHKQKKS